MRLFFSLMPRFFVAAALRNILERPIPKTEFNGRAPLGRNGDLMSDPRPANPRPTRRHSDGRTDSIAVPASDSSLAHAPGRIADLAAASLSKNTRRAY